MKNIILFSLLLACASEFSFASATPLKTKEINIAVNDVFVPEVTAPNTDAKIILNGMFPNSCYSWSRADVINASDTVHEIKAMALVTVNAMCLMVLVPYSREVNLGKLVPGDHTLRFISGDDTFFERKMVVQ